MGFATQQQDTVVVASKVPSSNPHTASSGLRTSDGLHSLALPPFLVFSEMAILGGFCGLLEDHAEGIRLGSCGTVNVPPCMYVSLSV